jgi:hypothetical protein
MFKQLALIAMFVLSGVAVAAPVVDEQAQVENPEPQYAPFGIEINKKYKSYKYHSDKHKQFITVMPEKPIKEFFQDYSVVLKQDSTVFNVRASGVFDAKTYSCHEIITFLEPYFLKSYPDTDGFSIVGKQNSVVLRNIVRKNEKYRVSLSCLSEKRSVYFEFEQLNRYPDMLKVDEEKFEGIDVKL